MLGRTHMAFGLTVANSALLLTYGHIPLYTGLTPLECTARMAVTLGGAYVASVFPDIDRMFPTHRGITHAVWFPAMLFYQAFWVFNAKPLLSALCFGAFLGYMSHLFGDAFSKAGVAWFYPLQGYERFPDGTFYVKGFRGPFLPLYTVGNRLFFFMPIVWYAAAAALLYALWGKIW